MFIFDSEKNDGLSEIISAKSSICYSSLAIATKDTNILSTNINMVSRSLFKDYPLNSTIASIGDEDLYFVQSILVSSSWNKNDDIFDKQEIWKARHTPEDKPTNLEHDENCIIGHITSNWPITEEGTLISEDIDMSELPDKYHILTGSVIYRAFTDIELKARAQKLIDEIESGDKFVSMECFFKSFDYGLTNIETGQYKILARNNETSHLTKYLRSYGGIGQHENYLIGRVLKDITFSGKGFVDRPANPDSIIFNKDSLKFLQKREEIIKSGVFTVRANTNSENTIMSSEETKIIAEIETETATPASEWRDPSRVRTVTIDSTDIVYTKEASDNLRAKVASLEMQVEAAKKSKEEMDKEEDDAEATVNNLKAELESANLLISQYKIAEAEMLKEKKKLARTASLVESGIATDLASSTVDKFENMDDAAFQGMKELLASMPGWLQKIVDEKKKKKEEEGMMHDEEEDMATKLGSDILDKKIETVDSSILENVEVQEDVNLGVGGASEMSEIDTTRAELVQFVCARLGKKLTN